MGRILKGVLLLAFFTAAPWEGTSALIPTTFPRGDGILTLYNTHSTEKAVIRYRNGRAYLKDGLEEVGWLLRCRADSKVKPMDLNLIELVDHLEDHFGAEEVRVISGYRSPEFNARLRRSGRKVAKYSRHMKGEAMDIRLPGVSAWKLRQYLVALKAGGVGYYPDRRFVHIDVGPFRTW